MSPRRRRNSFPTSHFAGVEDSALDVTHFPRADSRSAEESRSLGAHLLKSSRLALEAEESLVCDALALPRQKKSAQTLNLQKRAATPLNLQMEAAVEIGAPFGAVDDQLPRRRRQAAFDHWRVLEVLLA